MRDYSYFRQALEGVPLPAAFIDLDALDANIDAILKASGNIPIRVASKSIRCSHVLRTILSRSPQFCGVMSFTLREALFLAGNGFDDILVGYPSTNRSDIAAIVEANRNGKIILPMVDCRQHLELIHQEAQRLGVVQPICVDIDMSSKFPMLHFGVRRSPIDSLEAFKRFLESLNQFPSLSLEAIMGYEAQIAGVGDRNPASKLSNPIIRQLKFRSIREFTQRRQDIVRWAKDSGHKIRIVNGGGTGSLATTIGDSSITEVTVGSGFYSPGLFDHYDSFRYQPAAGFALEIVRQPSARVFTALGGGYIASGSAGWDKQPVPYLPGGLKLLANEGAGEVQTPFTYNGTVPLTIGDPVFFRHAKAGELFERFQQIQLIRNGHVVETVPTYRGEGLCFL